MELKFKIIGFERDAMFDDFIDGGSASFDAAAIEILSGSMRGQSLDVFIDPQSPDAAKWARVGDTISAQVNLNDLKNVDVIFAAAFSLRENAR